MASGDKSAIEAWIEERERDAHEETRLRDFVWDHRKIDPRRPLYSNGEAFCAMRRVCRLFEAGYGVRPGVIVPHDGEIYMSHVSDQTLVKCVDLDGTVWDCVTAADGEWRKVAQTEIPYQGDDEGYDCSSDFQDLISGAANRWENYRQTLRKQDKPWWRGTVTLPVWLLWLLGFIGLVAQLWQN